MHRRDASRLNLINKKMIQLTDILYYDENLTFEEQTEDVKEHIRSLMQAESEKQTNAFCGRTELESWNQGTFIVELKYNYLAPETAKNCFALANTKITVQEV